MLSCVSALSQARGDPPPHTHSPPFPFPLQIFLNAQRFNTSDSELSALAEVCRLRVLELFQTVVVDRTLAVADPEPFAGGPSASAAATATLESRLQQPSRGAADDDRSVFTAADVAWFLTWPSVKKSLTRNKYFRAMAITVMPILHKLQASLLSLLWSQLSP